MNILTQVRKQVVRNGKLRYGAASRIASLLGLSQYAVRRVLLDGGELDDAKLSLLEQTMGAQIPLYKVTAKDERCTLCGKPSHALRLCRKHYYAQWSKGILGN